MLVQYRQYNRNAIKGQPLRQYVGQWHIDYLPFSSPENAHKPPLVVIGGAFQNFSSYKYSVETVYQDFPVILLDLPSLGSNEQIAPDLGMEDLADLLYEFVRIMALPKVHLMGLSLGSAIASTFAYKHPQQMGKLIVAGIVTRPRKSWRMLIEESVRVLEEQRMDEFSQAVVLYLVNYQRLNETGITATARRLFYRQMKRLNENERERYKINGRRLLSVEGVLGYPSCDTLVTTGEFDSFTLPAENAEFARKCPNSTFVLIEGADHLPQLEKRDVSLALFSNFLNDRSLQEVGGIRVLDKERCGKLEQRRGERLSPVNKRARVVVESRIGERYRLDQSVSVIDINFFGCLLKLDAPGFSLADHDRNCTLHIESPNVQLELLVFEYDDQGRARCLFKHGNIDQAEQFSQLLQDGQLFRRPHNNDKVRQIHG